MAQPFDFDAPKWQDFTKGPYINQKKLLDKFLDNSTFTEPDDSDIGTESPSSDSSWFEVSHPEHESPPLMHHNLGTLLDSPNLARSRLLGPPLRKLPSHEGSFLLLDKNTYTNETSTESSPISKLKAHKRIRATNIATLSPIESGLELQTIFYSPKNRVKDSLDSSPSSTFSLDHYNSILFSSPFSDISQEDEYLDETQIENAPVSKLLQAFLDKKYKRNTIFKTDQIYLESKENDSHLLGEYKGKNADQYLKTLTSFSGNNDEQVEKKVNTNQPDNLIKKTLSFTTIQEHLKPSPSNYGSILGSPIQNYNLKPFDPHNYYCEFNSFISNYTDYQAFTESDSNELDEIFSMLAEHNAKVNRSRLNQSVL